VVQTLVRGPHAARERFLYAVQDIAQSHNNVLATQPLQVIHH